MCIPSRPPDAIRLPDVLKASTPTCDRGATSAGFQDCTVMSLPLVRQLKNRTVHSMTRAKRGAKRGFVRDRGARAHCVCVTSELPGRCSCLISNLQHTTSVEQCI